MIIGMSQMTWNMISVQRRIFWYVQKAWFKYSTELVIWRSMKENFKTVGDIDVDRINNILKNEVYVNVHVIE